MSRLCFDIETNGLLEQTSCIHSLCFEDLDTALIYSAHDHADNWNNPAEEAGIVITITIEEAVRKLMEADELIGHNIIKFDIPAIQKIFKWFKPRGEIIDTLVLSRLIFPAIGDFDTKQSRKGKFPGKLIGSHGLEAWGLRLGEWKGDYSKTMQEQGLDPWANWNPEMQTYCEQDIVVTRKLFERICDKNYSPQAIQLEHQFADIIAQQERYGFGFDEEAAARLYTVLIAKRQEIAEKLMASFPPVTERIPFVPKVNNKAKGYLKGVPTFKEKVVEFNPSSRQMIAKRLIDFGWKPEEFTPNGQPKVDETILSKLPWPEAKVLAQHFLIEKRIGQLAEGDQAWLRLVRRGRIHGGVNTNGAVTGRCTHSRPNVAQVPSVGSPYGEDCRALFCVGKGRKLVGADLSGLELRCLAHFMARYDDGEYGRILLEGDIHWANVVALGFVPHGTERNEDRYPIHKLFRNGAKTFIYGFLYGAGDAKAGSIVLDIAMREVRDGLGCSVFKKYFPAKGNELGYKPNPDEDDLKRVGKKLKKTFLDKTPAIKKLREAVAKAAERGYLIGLDGRRLHIRSAHAALNTLLQSAGALIAKQATVFAYLELCRRGYVFGRDFAFVAHVHDEMQVDCREAIADEVGEILVNAMRACTEQFNFRCPIDGEYKIGNNWKETH
ncbi:DNA polymerase [Brucella sp. 10RB9213]|uniref:DNA polymerase n=1 Tax=Brucella sp. 10RB9213 TaxID=1844039 RepID=UPI0012AD58C4|nr:DNA polymerase [Brucella sp. 10RB9213]MRN66392.1 DNA polymerase [Brucella sp. 10RB9213]